MKVFIRIVTVSIFSVILFSNCKSKEIKKSELDNKNTNFIISGELKVIFGTEISIPKEALLVLQPSNKTTNIDGSGHFVFRNIKKGKYNIQILDFNRIPKVFEVEIIDKSVQNFDIIIKSDCKVNTQIAKNDVKNNKIRLLLVGGIAPLINSNDSEIEKKYSFNYYDYGCIAPPIECIEQYNKVIFEYFDKKYDNKWRTEIRSDVIGL